MKYPIDKSFGIYSAFTPPLSRALIAFASVFQPLLPKKFPRGVDVKKIASEGVKGVLVSPAGCAGKLPCLVYFHGGGFVFNSGGYHYKNAAAYCLGAHCKVMFVDYPLAPKHKLPQISAACMAAYRAVYRMAEEWGVDADRIAVGGDSAGGFLAADLALRAVEEGVAVPVFAMLIYPVLDRRMSTPTMRQFTDTPMWNSRLNKKMWRYCLDGEYLTPSERRDLSSFPRAYIETAQYDCLCGEAEEFAARLKEQGVEAEYNPTSGTMHGFDIAVNSPITGAVLAQRTEALKAGFAKSYK